MDLTEGAVQDLTSQQKSEFILLNQAVETVLGIVVIKRLLRNYEPWSEDIFHFSFREPFRKPDGWLVWAILGSAAAPLLVSLTLGIFTALGYSDEGPSTVDEVVKIMTPDPYTFFGLLGVTAVLAPVLEEFVFRGFLLASLTTFMPVPAAVVASSAAFGGAHFSVKDFPELTVLGMLLAFSYIRTRNLLTPIAIHGLWNGTVLFALFVLSQQHS